MVIHGLSFSCVDNINQRNKNLLQMFVIASGMQMFLVRIVLLSTLFVFLYLLY